jgi:hypothetical protein
VTRQGYERIHSVEFSLLLIRIQDFL